MLFILFVIAVLSARSAYSKSAELKEQVIVLSADMKKVDAEKNLEYKEWALGQLEMYKEQELGRITRQLQKAADDAAHVKLQQWLLDNTIRIRAEAISKSNSVHMGKITEHLVPFHKQFPFNPKDARFIGSPIDIIVFDGLTEESDKLIIHFLEIKTGKSSLSARQRLIKEAVESKRVTWKQISIDSI